MLIDLRSTCCNFQFIHWRNAINLIKRNSSRMISNLTSSPHRYYLIQLKNGRDVINDTREEVTKIISIFSSFFENLVIQRSPLFRKILIFCLTRNLRIRYKYTLTFDFMIILSWTVKTESPPKKPKKYSE